MFITSKNKYLSNDMTIFGTCSIPLTSNITNERSTQPHITCLQQSITGGNQNQTCIIQMIEHFAKLLRGSGINDLGMADTANQSIVLNAHSKHTCLKLLLVCKYFIITTDVIF